MNTKIKILILFLIFSTFAFSQEEGSEYSSEIFNSDQASLNLLSNINFRQGNIESESLQNQQNAVLIQQIGYNNSIYTQTRSESSNLALTQNGDFNEIELVVNAPTINANILQNGNNNNIQDNIYYSNLGVKLNAIQQGNNLTINRIGVNSLSNNLQLIQEGSFKTITVISN